MVIIIQVGFLSGGPIWLFSFSVAASVLFGLRAALATALLNGTVIILLAWLSFPGQTGEQAFLSSLGRSIAALGSFVILNIIVSISVAVLVNGLKNLNQSAVAAAADLKQEKAALLKTRERLTTEIGERKRTAQDLEKARDAAEAANRAKSEFLANALKFTPEGGTIQVRAGLENGFSGGDKGLRFSVIDSGIGLDPGDLERIFRPFEQADNSISRRFQGAGLGLALSRKMVELHGGRIWAESEGEGKGSAFHFLVPFREENPSGHAEIEGNPPHPIPLPQTGERG